MFLLLARLDLAWFLFLFFLRFVSYGHGFLAKCFMLSIKITLDCGRFLVLVKTPPYPPKRIILEA